MSSFAFLSRGSRFVALLALAVGLGWIFFRALPNDARTGELRHLYLACKFFSEKNSGRLPLTLDELVPLYFIEGGETVSRQIIGRYELLQPALPLKGAEKIPLLAERPPGPPPPTRLAINGAGEIIFLPAPAP